MTHTSFEDRLLVQLRAVVAEQPDRPTGAVARARRRPSRRLGLAGAVCSGLAAAALIVALSGGSATPAYALQRAAGGDLTVTVNRLSDAAGLERALRAAGVRAVVDYTPQGKACREPRGNPARPGSANAGIVTRPGGAATFTVSRDAIAPGDTLVISNAGGTGASSIGLEVLAGTVTPCTLVPSANAAPAGTGAGNKQAPDDDGAPGTSSSGQ